MIPAAKTTACSAPVSDLACHERPDHVVAVIRALPLQALHPRVIRGALQNAATIAGQWMPRPGCAGPGNSSNVHVQPLPRRNMQDAGSQEDSRVAHQPTPRHPVSVDRTRAAAVGALRRGRLLRRDSPGAADCHSPLWNSTPSWRQRAATELVASTARQRHLDRRTRRLLRGDQAEVVRVRWSEASAAAGRSSPSGTRRRPSS